MRITDIFLALPGPILAIAVVAALGPSLTAHADRGGHRVVAVLLPHRPRRGQGPRRPTPPGGGPPGRSRAGSAWPCATCCPGAIPATMVTASLDVGNLVLTLAGLSFLGLGAPGPGPRARGHGRPGPDLSARRSGGCRSCPDWPCCSWP